MILYATVLLFGLLGIRLVYRYDLYEREPWYLLVATLGFGFFTMRGIAWVESFSLSVVTNEVAIAAVAASHEEAARLGLVLVLAWLYRTEFNDPMDGIVYGSVAGLGMGVEESFHLFSVRPGLPLGHLPVELVRLLGHGIMGGMTGFGVGMAWMAIPRWPLRLLGALSFATLLHFSWDWIALTSPTTAAMTLWQTGAAILLMSSGLFVYGMLVVVSSAWSKRAFAPDSRVTLWGWPLSLWLDPRRDEDARER